MKPEPEPCGTSSTSSVKASCLHPKAPIFIAHKIELSRANQIESREQPRGEVGDVDDGGGVLLEEPHGGELVGLEPPRGGDDEGGGWVDVGDEERRGKGDGSEDGDDGFEQPTGRRDRR